MIKILGSFVLGSALSVGVLEKSGGLPVLLLPAAGCSCLATQGEGWLVGVSSSCLDANGGHPCFVFTVSALGTIPPRPGQCQILSNDPNVPDPCPAAAEDCSYPAYNVKVEIASCAGASGSNPPDCGQNPYIITDPGGGTKKAGRGSKIDVPVFVTDLACRGSKPYKIKITSAANTLVAEFQIIARCGKCDSDPVPLPE
ncbi:MAG: hypothetical protein ACK501_18780 [Planctomycetota bacterium]|jgi:hypothetical protein